ncbi:MAG: hypothetical protein MUE81_18005 [Thermoflexibacter sp.]|jgi:hypothetical protein|nr:hypothetical protein [Thermoflexibacter sp.]
MQMIRKALCRLMLRKARSMTYDFKYDFLQKPVEKWKNHDYADFASVIEISTSTLKRIFNCKGHPTPQDLRKPSKQKIANFLSLKTWEEVEKECIFDCLQIDK